MVSLKDIREWWEKKIGNFIKEYIIRKNLSLVEARSQLFSETYEIFLEAISESLFETSTNLVMLKLTLRKKLTLNHTNEG
jgi:hypothetical protein